MKSFRRAFPTGWRLLRGAVQSAGDRVGWSSAWNAIQSADLVSFDVFDTLLRKAPDLDREVAAGVRREILSELVRREIGGVADEASVAARLSRIERRLARQALENGDDPEIPRRRLYEELFASLSPQPLAPESVDRLLRREIELLHRGTFVDPEICELVQRCRASGKRVVAISDTCLGADGIASLLRLHRLDGFDAIYASCDLARSKFHGGLFDEVRAREGVASERMVHIGDNALADVYSPRSRGIRGVRRPASTPESRPVGFRLGFETIGPVFAAFSHLLLLEAERERISRLAFVARDGEFLRQCAERLSAAAPFLTRPRLDYVYLSRRATALSARERLDASALEDVRGIRAEGMLLQLFFEYFDLDPQAAATGAEGTDAVSLRSLIATAEFQAFVEEQKARQKTLLAEYLDREGLFRGGAVAFVDVGWRASTQRAIHAAFAGTPGFVPPRFYYFGLWSEFGRRTSPGGPAVGILADQRRRATVREGAAWQLAFLIESICRASHPTVAGFARDSRGAAVPRFAHESPSRRDEILAEKSRDPIRQGILACVDAYGRGLSPGTIDEAALRRRAQLRMLRLAFFPRPWEREAVSGLVQTEGHACGWSAPLIASERPHPLRSPRRWLAGLSSPWRGGYVAATGGYPMALAFFGLESLLTATPRGLRVKLRRWALRASGAGEST